MRLNAARRTVETAAAGSSWNVAPAAGRAVAATFQDEPEAAVSTVRRTAFNRIYREELCEP